jgi:hypothetical protein
MATIRINNYDSKLGSMQVVKRKIELGTFGLPALDFYNYLQTQIWPTNQ